ncbi:MAG: hypothetical protein WBX16_26530, partial [Candidatus Acidiferrales bacterium]
MCAFTASRRAAVAIAAVFLISTAAHAQDQPPQRVPSSQNSELGRENLSHVSASAGETGAGIIRDIGLMMELKRWVAKDATSHGQIITDSDATEDAIFDRLGARRTECLHGVAGTAMQRSPAT